MIASLMKRVIFINLIIIYNSFSIFALSDFPDKEDSTKQTKTIEKKNLSFVELGGNGLVLSINYERYIFDNLSLRIGFGTGVLEGLTFPLLINYSFEIPIEIGIGILPYSHMKKSEFFESDNSILITSNFGFKRINKGFIFKVSITPFYNPENSKFRLYGGLSFGIAF